MLIASLRVATWYLWPQWIWRASDKRWSHQCKVLSKCWNLLCRIKSKVCFTIWQQHWHFAEHIKHISLKEIVIDVRNRKYSSTGANRVYQIAFHEYLTIHHSKYISMIMHTLCAFKHYVLETDNFTHYRLDHNTDARNIIRLSYCQCRNPDR